MLGIFCFSQQQGYMCAYDIRRTFGSQLRKWRNDHKPKCGGMNDGRGLVPVQIKRQVPTYCTECISGVYDMRRNAAKWDDIFPARSVRCFALDILLLTTAGLYIHAHAPGTFGSQLRIHHNQKCGGMNDGLVFGRTGPCAVQLKRRNTTIPDVYDM